MDLSCNKITVYIIKRNNSKTWWFFYLNFSILLEQKISLGLIKKYVRIKISVEL